MEGGKRERERKRREKRDRRRRKGRGLGGGEGEKYVETEWGRGEAVRICQKNWRYSWYQLWRDRHTHLPSLTSVYNLIGKHNLQKKNKTIHIHLLQLP